MFFNQYSLHSIIFLITNASENELYPGKNLTDEQKLFMKNIALDNSTLKEYLQGKEYRVISIGINKLKRQ